jgi:hypothetical protein
MCVFSFDTHERDQETERLWSMEQFYKKIARKIYLIKSDAARLVFLSSPTLGRAAIRGA